MHKRYVTEMGMGTDVHGRDYTLAAERAIFDAIHHSSLNFFQHLDKNPEDMIIELMIGVPEPDQVNKNKLAEALPYGKVQVKVIRGGLEIPSDEGDDSIVIANAGVIVRLDD